MSPPRLVPALRAASAALVVPVDAVGPFRGRRHGRPGLWLASGQGVLLLVILAVVALVVLFLVLRSRRP